MFIGDSQTMSTEASLLGTPAIRCNSLVGTQHGAGNYHELEHKYDLLYSFSSPREAFAKLQTLVDDASLTGKWVKKHQRLLSEKTDVVKFVANYVERYGEVLRDIR